MSRQRWPQQKPALEEVSRGHGGAELSGCGAPEWGAGALAGKPPREDPALWDALGLARLSPPKLLVSVLAHCRLPFPTLIVVCLPLAQPVSLAGRTGLTQMDIRSPSPTGKGGRDQRPRRR